MPLWFVHLIMIAGPQVSIDRSIKTIDRLRLRINNLPINMTAVYSLFFVLIWRCDLIWIEFLLWDLREIGPKQLEQAMRKKQDTNGGQMEKQGKKRIMNSSCIFSPYNYYTLHVQVVVTGRVLEVARPHDRQLHTLFCRDFWVYHFQPFIEIIFYFMIMNCHDIIN